MEEATKIVMDYIRSYAPEANKALLAGNSVGTDKTFLVRDMPEVIDHLHYRILDVSTIKELARRWYPRAFFQAPAKTGNHRALGDIQDSIDELKYYRAAVMVPAPGPDGPRRSGSPKKVMARRTHRHRPKTIRRRRISACDSRRPNSNLHHICRKLGGNPSWHSHPKVCVRYFSLPSGSAKERRGSN